MIATTKKIILTGVFTLMATGGIVFGVKSQAQTGRESANGQGTLITKNDQGKDVRRRFSFSAQRDADGTVKGRAVLHNPDPEFVGENDKKFQASFDITCMKVVGNTAILGGTVKRTTDPNLTTAAFFNVQDNGEPGKDRDKITLVNFSDGSNTPGDCQLVNVEDFPLFTIESGNVQVRGAAAP